MNNLLLTTTIAACVATSSAFTSPPHHQACPLSTCGKSHNAPLFASSNDKPFFIDDSAADDCGPGFQKIQGTDGPCCAYDFDAVSSKITPNVFDNNPTLLTKFEEKNKARRKFDLPPLSPEEFVVLQAQIHAMQREEGESQAVAKQAAMEEREEKERRQEQEQREGVFQSFMGSMFQDTCQSNFDCNRPEVCCDFGFKKICCSSGNTNRDIENELALIPVPQRG
mmetsp:Transcript_18425/g.39850  ORF Transcript_18425/g.39850 Transcript_18425/m.39850 type:complete len:224 (-) Transcript_18425:184-855(-)|eukprot:CAMPEP_0172323726 /NCGR_PEP_ID=MMETSP1058-20130122/49449_1 /TAXON_ID=83371 /ORGANISM="Detonula confervacea, Strain CCMP 353" /LENGTH=223 /DNA_ID=CAMNT_0013039803 /DNA_START=109 /DNA_END=780 /DNA_ORIENTATION=-